MWANVVKALTLIPSNRKKKIKVLIYDKCHRMIKQEEGRDSQTSTTEVLLTVDGLWGGGRVLFKGVALIYLPHSNG